MAASLGQGSRSTWTRRMHSGGYKSERTGLRSIGLAECKEFGDPHTIKACQKGTRVWKKFSCCDGVFAGQTLANNAKQSHVPLFCNIQVAILAVERLSNSGSIVHYPFTAH